MTKIQFETPITEDGIYVFPSQFPYREYLVEVVGNLGGGEISIGYDDGLGNFVSFNETSSAFIAALPSSGKFALEVTSSTSPLLIFKSGLLV